MIFLLQQPKQAKTGLITQGIDKQNMINTMKYYAGLKGCTYYTWQDEQVLKNSFSKNLSNTMTSIAK